jgi:demethylmenaquinone methyltransferase/2-methoxy-6-polyprenyl-1,4-benzoquinol methylase
MSNNTHFGFRTVAEEEKSTLVRGVFDHVASRYDIMNDLMSGGLHRLWKNEMVAWLNPRDGMNILDVAGGTGDIAFRILNRAACAITICDINQHMLEEGRNRAIDRNILHGIDWLCANAEVLPLPDGAFDAYTIAFGIRNVTHIDSALKEACRVLKPGGRFLCLEFSYVAHEWLQKAYDAYSFHVIPKIGKWVTGSDESYKYLVESIRQFPKQEELAEMIKVAGFGNVQYRNMTQGVVAIHSGRRL